MRAAALALAALTAGCSWTFTPDEGWLPLVGDPPSLGDAPHYASDGWLDGYQASDGRIWIKIREPSDPGAPGDLVLRSFDRAAEERRFAPPAFVADEGVVAAAMLPTDDSSRTGLRLTLDRLGAGPVVSRDVTLETTVPPPEVVRGPGYFVVTSAVAGDPGGATLPPVLLFFDDGRDDSIAAGSDGWRVSVAGAAFGSGVERVIEGSAQFILLHGTSDGELAAYDLARHTLLRLGVPPPRPPSDPSNPNFQPPPPYFYDRVEERVWLCGEQTRTVSLRTGDSRELPFGCIDLRGPSGDAGELLVQAPDGTVYALAADGSAVTALGTFPPHGIRAASGRAFLYVRAPADEPGRTFSAWLGTTRVVRAGMGARFSADGQRLYWLEDVAGPAGDLWSFDLATATAHPLVRNVSQFDLLPDGRLIAIANAALSGSFNRAVIVDEAAGQARWLAPNAQSVQRFGDQLIIGRSNDVTHDFYRTSLPPRTPTTAEQHRHSRFLLRARSPAPSLAWR